MNQVGVAGIVARLLEQGRVAEPAMSARDAHTAINSDYSMMLGVASCATTRAGSISNKTSTYCLFVIENKRDYNLSLT